MKKSKRVERKDLDFLGSIDKSEESDKLLLVSKESTGCGGSKMASKGSTECEGFEGAAMVVEMQRQV